MATMSTQQPITMRKSEGAHLNCSSKALLLPDRQGQPSPVSVRMIPTHIAWVQHGEGVDHHDAWLDRSGGLPYMLPMVPKILKHETNLCPLPEIFVPDRQEQQEDDQHSLSLSTVSDIDEAKEDQDANMLFESQASTLSRCSSTRSIFGNYWERSGEAPLLQAVPAWGVTRRSSAEPLLVGTTTTQQQPPLNASLRRCSRRFLFSGAYAQSAPALNSGTTTIPTEIPTLGRRPRSKSVSESRPRPMLLASCLRPSTRSKRSTSDLTNTSSQSSVSFDDKVQVMEFQPPLVVEGGAEWARHFGG